MELTPEQLEVLIKGFQEHDFTPGVHLFGGIWNAEKKREEDDQPREYNPLENTVRSYMKRNLPALGFKRNMNNFTDKHPVNLLITADAQYISDEAMAIMEDDEQCAKAVDEFCERFEPVLDFALRFYCEAKGKTEDELTEDDFGCILNRAANTINEELMNVVMQAQQFPAINTTAHKNLTHEDFGDKFNFDSINFHDQWTRCNTQVQEMLSLDAELEKEAEDPDALSTIEPGHEVDFVSQTLINTFCETLNDIDTTIFRMRMDGYTHVQIAERLGYKHHSTVLKRVKKIAARWTEYMNETKASS